MNKKKGFIMNNRFHKSAQNKLIFGVCGGLAESFNIDASIIRIIWILAILCLGTGLLLYLFAA